MHVRGVVWAGVRTERYAETVAFFRDVLGVPLVEVAPGFAWSKLEDSSQFEIFGPPESEHEHFTTGPVPEFLGPIQGAPEQGWLHFRGPDGNVYGLTDGTSYGRP